MAESMATNGDVVAKLLRQRQLQDFAASKFNEGLDVPANVDPETATEWVFTSDCRFAGAASAGVVFYPRGKTITYMPIIRQLRLANAPIRPVR